MGSNSKKSTSAQIKKFFRSETFAHKLMVLPAILVLLGIMYPFLIGVFTSFTDKKLYADGFQFVFLDNYIRNFQNPVFLTSLGNTLLYTLMALALQLPAGVLLALLLDSKTKLRPVLRSVLVFPLLIPPVVSSLMWKTMMHPSSGVLNYLLSLVGAGPFSFLSGVNTALFSLVLMDTWVYTPFATIIILSGLQAMPLDIVEASQVDGASGFRAFFSIKLPWLKPYILLATLFRACDSLKAFEFIYSTTRGGPMNASRTLNIMAYEEAFRWSNTGQALSIIFTLWIIAYLVSNVLVKLWNRSGIE